MTNDEINKAINAVTAILPDSRDRAIFRAGMREAAKIARLYEWSRAAAVHIERATGGEG